MKLNSTIAVTILDYVLILMTATWILVGVYSNISFLDIIYNLVYVCINITTLILNIKLLHKKSDVL